MLNLHARLHAEKFYYNDINKLLVFLVISVMHNYGDYCAIVCTQLAG